jgi:hypothetical protein
MSSRHLMATFLLLSENFGFVDVGAFYLMRGRVCNTQLLLASANLSRLQRLGTSRIENIASHI